MANPWVIAFLCSFFRLITLIHGKKLVDLTLVKDAVNKGAVCLDGSPAAYSFVPGFESGVDNWIIFLEGGGWCSSDEGCNQRRDGPYGSSINHNKTKFSEIFDDDPAFNPDFYNWNKVFLVYCDGGSFTGNVEEVYPQYKLWIRGSRIFNSVMDELLDMGLKNAQNAILAGTSAGGLATYLQCDKFRDLIPNTKRVKCIADSGFFFYGENHRGADVRKDNNVQLLQYHGMLKFLPESCTSRMDPALCLFPENFVADIKTPIFILESTFDWWKIQWRYLNYDERHDPAWQQCLTDITNCPAPQLAVLEDFRNAFFESFRKVDYSSSQGWFVHNCYVHGHIVLIPEVWRCPHIAGDTTIAKMISEWYFDRKSVQIIMPPGNPRNCSLTKKEIENCTLKWR